MDKGEGELLARFLELIDNKWLALRGSQEWVMVRYIGPREKQRKQDGAAAVREET